MNGLITLGIPGTISQIITGGLLGGGEIIPPPIIIPDAGSGMGYYAIPKMIFRKPEEINDDEEILLLFGMLVHQ